MNVKLIIGLVGGAAAIFAGIWATRDRNVCDVWPTVYIAVQAAERLLGPNPGIPNYEDIVASIEDVNSEITKACAAGEKPSKATTKTAKKNAMIVLGAARDHEAHAKAGPPSGARAEHVDWDDAHKKAKSLR